MFRISSAIRSPVYKQALRLLSLAILAAPCTALGSESSKPAKDARAPEVTSPELAPEMILIERISVVGHANRMDEIGGSAHVIRREELNENRYNDIHRILQMVPGVTVQEEDGYGLRPNIGMRGTGVERSQKITILEDGVLIAPAPYAAPAAYYFPTVGRMESIEVRKGSASIKYGPYTNGGALNLISASIPGSFSMQANATVGSYNTQRFQGLVGSTGERFGWMVQTFNLRSDGFKELDGGGDTGTDIDDFVGKLRMTTGAGSRRQQFLELKLGKTAQLGNETYLGLTEADFDRNPYRRYVGSALDRIDTDHEQIQLRHLLKPTARFDVTTTAYKNDYYRDWFKNESVAGISNRLILSDPDAFAHELAILRGEVDSAAGDLHLRHNQREYFSRGVESILGLSLDQRGASHQFELGLRYHEDQEDRLQAADLYQMLSGELRLTSVGLPGSNSNRVGDARATALFFQDRLRLQRWTVTLGARWESIRHLRTDFSKSDPSRSLGSTRVRVNNVAVLIPGIGIAFELAPRHHLFGGLHRGFAPPGTGSTDEVRPEESLNYELGYRYRGGALSAELTAFYSDYDNLLGVETVAGGGGTGGDLFNGGEVEVHGLEASLRQRWRFDNGLTMPLRLAYTYTATAFESSFATSFADWSPLVVEGDELPYIPEHQLHMSLGLLRGDWSANLRGSFTEETRTSAGQGPIPQSEGTDERLVLDLGLQWDALERVGFFAQVRNLFDEDYLVARRPYGARPGLRRSLLLGASVEF